MHVGVTENPPWVLLDGAQPSGIEVDLVNDLAAELDAEIEWTTGSEQELAGAVEQRELDLLIGGITSDSSLAQEVTLTHPYVTTQVVVAAPETAAVPDDIAGLEVAVEAGTEDAGLLKKTDAVVEEVDDPLEYPGLKVVHDWEMRAKGLHDTGVRLKESDHVWGVPHGENAWLTHIERFLLAREEQIRDALEGTVP